MRIHKDSSTFCYPENIAAEMDRLFLGWSGWGVLAAAPRDEFARMMASFMADLNAIHPFREGNGRTMNVFVALLSHHSGHPINIRRIRKAAYLDAMIASFRGNEAPLAALIQDWLAP